MGLAEHNKQVVDRAYKLIFAGDFDGFFACFDEDATLSEPETLPYGGTFRGISNVKAAIQRMASHWSAFSLDFHEVLASDTTVAAVTTFNATSAKTGKKVSIPMVEVWRVKGDKITSVQPIYGDTALVIKALSD